MPASTSFDDVQKIAHALPGVEDGTSSGTRALKVRGKLFAASEHELPGSSR